MKKRHILAVLVMVISLMFSMSVYADSYTGGTWDGLKYTTPNGTAVTNGFHDIKKSGSYYAYTYYFVNGTAVTGWQEISGKTYYFDSTGKMSKNTTKSRTVVVNASTGATGSRYFFLGADGAAIKTQGWQSTTSSKYYVGSDGWVLTGWQTIDGNKYYFSSTGSMYKGQAYYIYFSNLGGYKYVLFDNNGLVVNKTGWVLSEGDWYYLESDGFAKIGWFTEGNNTYYLSVTGMRADGYASIYNGELDEYEYFLFAENGALITGTGWKLYNDCWYYLEDNNTLASGWRYIGGKWYYFSISMYQSGRTSIYNYDLSKYEYFLFDDSGAMMSGGWCLYKGSWYYADASGVLKSGWQTIDGKKYYFSTSSYAMIQGQTYKLANSETGVSERLLFDETGALWTGGWKFVDEEWYYTNANGVVTTGWLYDGGYWYYFDSYGEMYYDTYLNISVSEGSSEKIRYYFKPNGQMITGWYNWADAYAYNPIWLYCNADGSAYTGWISSGGKWYYIENGYAHQYEYHTEYIDINGNVTDEEYDSENERYNTVKRYFFGADGAMITGWCHCVEQGAGYYYDTWIYAHADGTIEKGWVSSGGKWYYVDSYGEMYRDDYVYTMDYPSSPSTSDFKDADGNVDWDAYDDACYKWQDEFDQLYEQYLNSVYIFDKDGVMVTGWYKMESSYGGQWVYTNADGRAYHGWLLSGGKWYFIDRGYMLTNSFTEDGYYVGADGTMQ